MKSRQKPALRSRGFIGARPASTVSAGTEPSKLDGPAKSRGAIKPETGLSPSAMTKNIRPPGKWSLK